MIRDIDGREIPTQPDIYAAIIAVGCTTCGASPTTDSGDWPNACSEKARGLDYRYVVPPHPARVRAAGFQIAVNPVDAAVRWYAPLNDPDERAETLRRWAQWRSNDTVLAQIRTDGNWVDYARCKAWQAVNRGPKIDGCEARYVDWITKQPLNEADLSYRASVERAP